MSALALILAWAGPLAAAPSGLDVLDCVINPSVVADLGSGVPGVLSAVAVDRSDFVEAGEVIAELESGVEAAALDLARARAGMTTEMDLRRVNAAFGWRQHERTADLFERKVISTNDKDQRETEARLAQLELQQARDNHRLAELELVRSEEVLARRVIRSPITGVVMERFKVVGEYVEDKPVVRVAQLDPLHVEVIVPVAHLGQVNPGMRALVRAGAAGDVSWQATVSRVDRVADVASGTYGARLVLPNPDNRIPAGLRCEVQFIDEVVDDTEAAPAPDALAEPAPPLEVPVPDPGPTNAVAGAAGPTPAVVEDADAEPAPPEVAAPEPPPEVAGPAPPPEVAGPAPPPGPPVTQAGRTSAAVDAVAPTPAVQPGAELASCRWAGPFPTEAVAQAQRLAVQAAGMQADVQRREISVVSGQRVVSPVLPDRTAAESLVSRLRAAGISDLHLPSGAGPARVALGLYRNPDTAQRRREQLAARGFETELLPWRTSATRYFFVIAGEPDDLPLPELSERPQDESCARLASR